MKTFSVVYIHPESHGPQICAIHMMAKYSSEVNVLHKNAAITDWKFPENVTLIKDGGLILQDEMWNKGILVKSFHFLRFAYKLLSNLNRKKYDVIAIFDQPALYAYKLIHKLVRYKPIVWYHNYDIIFPNTSSKYSLNGLATSVHENFFSKIDYFSLPMEERVQFFPIGLLKNKYKILPNYSLLEIHSAQPRKIDSDTFKLIFVGSIGPGHGIEELIPMINTSIRGKKIELYMKGHIRESYKNQVIKLAEKCGTRSGLTILPKGPWREVPAELRKCHAGIAIYDLTKNTMVATLGKGGSGKIYQYIAEGLPVIINQEFYPYFEDEEWAVSTPITKEGLTKSIEYIIENQDSLSERAVNRFVTDLNCNKVFNDFFQNELFNERN